MTYIQYILDYLLDGVKNYFRHFLLIVLKYLKLLTFRQWDMMNLNGVIFLWGEVFSTGTVQLKERWYSFKRGIRYKAGGLYFYRAAL